MANVPANQPPKSMTSGYTPDPPWGPLAQCGAGDPFFYHSFYDDFDVSLIGGSGDYTVTKTTGTAVHGSADGGVGVLTTSATANDFTSIQPPAGSFTLPATGNSPPGTASGGKKLFYACRLQLSDVTLATFIAGLCVITATPFAAGVRNVVDGLFFYKAPGAANNLQLINVASNGGSPSGASFTNTFAVPTSAYTLANATNLDLAFYIDRNQNLFAFVNAQLFGWIPNSGTGAIDPVTGLSILPSNGPVLANYNFQSQGVQTPIMYTTTVLAPTFAVSNGVTAVAKSGTIDFHGAFKER